MVRRLASFSFVATAAALLCAPQAARAETEPDAESLAGEEDDPEAEEEEDEELDPAEIAELLADSPVMEAVVEAETARREPGAGRYVTVVRAPGATEGEVTGRASTAVTRRQMEERLPRSAPDALRYEPGAFVQQTAHGQASTFVRGQTGQQTVLLFDGIRLNNSTYRQGPNQYFFTVDSRSVATIEVMRGSASVLFGSDALGGVIAARPIEPRFFGTAPFRLTPRTSYWMSTADEERGGRFELEAQVFDRFSLIGGVSYRTVGLLEGGGTLLAPETGEAALVPRMAEDGRTQLGTGFDELTFDARLVARISDRARAIAAVYGYREYDAPRTDQCPAAFAPWNECMTYEEQFRTLAYLAFEGDLGVAARPLWVSLSFQRQHERRRLDRPSSFVELTGQDDAHTIGLVARAQTDLWRPIAALELGLRYGADLYVDWLDSAAWSRFTDVDVQVERSRGLYLDDSSYVWWGAYAEGEARWRRLTFRAGGRLAVMSAVAPGDEASGSQAVDQTWLAPVGRCGLEWSPWSPLSLLLNVDQGFRAPNLDDLTSRQQTGPGFQFENAGLEPERSLTVESGIRFEHERFRAQAFVFWTFLEDTIVRAPRTADECPPDTPGCASSWHRFQLVNADEPSHIYGAEVAALVRIPYGFRIQATLAYAFGEGPNPGDPPTTPGVPWEPRVPLSRVPPLNGTVEARWYMSEIGIFAGAGLRWALAQERLAPSDVSDERIPAGGTPGFAVLDLRLGWRYRRNVLIALVFENVTDEVYRYHGSSVNGPGRGLLLSLELGL